MRRNKCNDQPSIEKKKCNQVGTLLNFPLPSGINYPPVFEEGKISRCIRHNSKLVFKVRNV